MYDVPFYMFSIFSPVVRNESTEISKSLIVKIIFLFRKYFLSVPRPFDIRYNAYTQSIELLDKKAGS